MAARNPLCHPYIPSLDYSVLRPGIIAAAGAVFCDKGHPSLGEIEIPNGLRARDLLFSRPQSAPAQMGPPGEAFRHKSLDTLALLPAGFRGVGTICPP